MFDIVNCAIAVTALVLSGIALFDSRRQARQATAREYHARLVALSEKTSILAAGFSRIRTAWLEFSTLVERSAERSSSERQKAMVTWQREHCENAIRLCDQAAENFATAQKECDRLFDYNFERSDELFVQLARLESLVARTVAEGVPTAEKACKDVYEIKDDWENVFDSRPTRRNDGDAK